MLPQCWQRQPSLLKTCTRSASYERVSKRREACLARIRFMMPFHPSGSETLLSGLAAETCRTAGWNAAKAVDRHCPGSLPPGSRRRSFPDSSLVICWRKECRSSISAAPAQKVLACTESCTLCSERSARDRGRCLAFWVCRDLRCPQLRSASLPCRIKSQPEHISRWLHTRAFLALLL